MVYLTTNKRESHSSHDEFLDLIEGLLRFGSNAVKVNASLVGGKVEDKIEETHDADLFLEDLEVSGESGVVAELGLELDHVPVEEVDISRVKRFKKLVEPLIFFSLKGLEKWLLDKFTEIIDLRGDEESLHHLEGELELLTILDVILLSVGEVLEGVGIKFFDLVPLLGIEVTQLVEVGEYEGVEIRLETDLLSGIVQNFDCFLLVAEAENENAFFELADQAGLFKFDTVLKNLIEEIDTLFGRLKLFACTH